MSQLMNQQWKRLGLAVVPLAAWAHAGVASAEGDTIYLRCETVTVLKGAGVSASYQEHPRPTAKVYRLTGSSLSSVDTNVPGMMFWGQDQCIAHAADMVSCALTANSFTLSSTHKDATGVATIVTDLVIDRVQGTFSEVANFPRKDVQAVTTGTCAATRNPIP